MPSERDDSLLEQIDDRVRKATELTERWRYWNERQRASLSQRYIDGDLEICVREEGVNPRQNGLIFRALIGRQITGPDDPEIMSTQSATEVARHSKQFPMLSRNIHLVEGIKSVIPSLVWHETFDGCAVLSGKPIYLFKSSVFWVDKITDAPADGKVGFFIVREAVARGENDCKDIKTASDAVDDNAGLDVDKQRYVGGSVFDGLLSHLVIELDGNIVRGLIPPGFDSPLKGFELGYGPINCGPGF